MSGLLDRLTGAWRSWKSEVDAAASEAPLLGEVFARRWRILRVETGRMTLDDGRGGRAELPDHMDAGTARGEIAALSQAGPVVLRFAPALGFRRPARFPASAKAHLDNAVRLALPRLSPLPADDVAWAVDQSSVTETDGRIETQVALVRRDALEHALARAEAIGLTIAAADLEGVSADAAPEFDLRPGRRRPSAGRSALKAGLIAAALLFALAGGLWVDQSFRLQPAAEALAPEGADDPRMISAAAHRRAMRAAPPVSDLLADLSARLPDGAYAQSIEVEGDRVRINLLAWETGSTLQAIEASPEFDNAEFEGAMVRQDGSGRERFTITARYLGRTESGS